MCLLVAKAIEDATLSASEVSFTSDIFTRIHPDGVCMLKAMMDFDQVERLTAAEALLFPYMVQRALLSTMPLEGVPNANKQVRFCSVLL